MRNYPALSFLALVHLWAQTPPPPGAPPPPTWIPTSPEGAPKTFEVASVKINKSPYPTSGMNYGPGRLSLTNSTLAGLVTWAYGVKDYQILAAPSWFRSDRYDVIAKARGAPDLADLKLLLQALLADRFHLTLHKETRQLPIFTLNLGERGIRMKRAPVSTDSGRAASLRNTDTPQITGRSNATHKELNGHNATITGLIQTLAWNLDRPLIDKTGLKGNYDFKLEWNPDENDPSGISLFTAIKEQLGLRLDSAKGPVAILVIDHAERVPTGN